MHSTMTYTYINIEYADMHLLYGVINRNSRELRRESRECFQTDDYQTIRWHISVTCLGSISILQHLIGGWFVQDELLDHRDHRTYTPELLPSGTSQEVRLCYWNSERSLL